MSPTTNLVIATYAGKYSVMNKGNYLKYLLILLNNIKTNITQITIMKSKVNEEHYSITDYYNFNNIDITNIRDKIKIIECENVGISYGALFRSFEHTNEFDYHIFMEDDYICFMDNFEQYMIDHLKQDTFLCMISFKNTKWNIMKCIEAESETIKNEFISILNKYDITKNFKEHEFYIPDYSIGIISKITVKKILSIIPIDTIMDLFKPRFRQLWIHQVIFGYILFLASINVDDTSDKNINLFYHTGREVTMCNYPDPFNWRDQYKEPFDIPIFCPIEFFYPYNQNNNMFILKKFSKNYDLFKERYYFLNNIKRSINI